MLYTHRKATPAELVDLGREQRSWPFKDMEPGDVVEFFDSALFYTAQQRAHAYGYRLGFVFKTKRTRNSMKVYRIS